MKKTILFLAFGLSLTGYAQVNKSVVRAGAYFTIPMPGTVKADDNGRQMRPPRNKQYNVFIETKGAAPQWSKAWTDGKLFTLVPLQVNGDSAIIGKRKTDDKKIMMKAGKGNTLQAFELSSPPNHQPPPQKVGAKEMLLEGKEKGKRFYYKISTLTELASPEYQ